MTSMELVADAADRLAAAGVPAAGREARLLLRAVASVDARLHPLAEIPAEVAGAYAAVVERRARREPYAYITGRREFFGLSLEVDRHVLIPRPETELLVERALALAPRGAMTCDLCTGSGAVALALAAQRPDLQLTATDISGEALSVAERNARRLGLRLRLFAGDLWAALPASDRGTLDLCTCNPPYVDAADWLGLDPEVRSWEPRQALVPPEGWGCFLHRLVAGAAEWLKPGGWLLAEVGVGQALAAGDLFVRNGLTEVRSHHDLAGIPRVIEGRRVR